MSADEQSEDTNARVTIATLRGEMRTGFAEMNGKLTALLDSMTRRDSDHAALEAKVTVLDVDVQALKMWRVQVEATEQAAPRLTWGAFLTDAKGWALALLTIAAMIYGFTK
jgi:hypothetical protein